MEQPTTDEIREEAVRALKTAKAFSVTILTPTGPDNFTSSEGGQIRELLREVIKEAQGMQQLIRYYKVSV